MGGNKVQGQLLIKPLYVAEKNCAKSGNLEACDSGVWVQLYQHYD